MAVRHVSGEIVMEQWVTSGQSKPRVWKTPFLRGIYNMIDSMRFGYKCLMRSAELAGFEDEEPKKKVTAMDELSAGPGPDAEEAVPPGPARTGLEPEEPVSDIGEESASPVPGPETTALPDPAVQPAAGETAKGGRKAAGLVRKIRNDAAYDLECRDRCRAGGRAVFISAVLPVQVDRRPARQR